MKLGSRELLFNMCFVCVQSCRLGPCSPSRPAWPHIAGAGLCLESRYGSWHRSALLSRIGLWYMCTHTHESASTKLGSQCSTQSLFLWSPGTTSCRAQVTASRQTHGGNFHHMSPSLVSVSCDLLLVAIAFGHGPPLSHSVPELMSRLTGEGA